MFWKVITWNGGGRGQSQVKRTGSAEAKAAIWKRMVGVVSPEKLAMEGYEGASQILTHFLFRIKEVQLTATFI